MIEAAYHMRHTPSISVEAAGTKWRDELAKADLFISHVRREFENQTVPLPARTVAIV